MRYLRMLTNAAAGGLLGTAYLTVLVVQLNPQMPLEPAGIGQVAAVILLSYGAGLTVLFYAFILLRQLVTADSLSPGWLSLRVLPWLAAGVAAGAAGLMWMNQRVMQAAVDPAAAGVMATGAAVTTTSALALWALAIVQYSFGRRGRRAVAALFALVLTLSIAIPLALRSPAPERPLGAYRLDVSGWMTAPAAATSGRVTMLLLDGASLDYVSPAAAEGRLPNFGRLLDSGASMHLATVHPTQPGPVWATVATGKYPWRHGVRAAATYDFGNDVAVELLPDLCYAHALVRLGLVRAAPHTSAALQARPFWSILSGFGVAVGVVGLPLTQPAQPVLGYLVSDRTYRFRDGPRDRDAEPMTYPADLEMAVRTIARDSEMQVGGPSVGVSPAARAFEAQDRAYTRMARELSRRYEPRFVAVRYQGLDAAGHQFLRHAMPELFGDVTDAERREFGTVLDHYYGLVDVEIGAAIDALGPGDLLLVVSGFGMEPVTLGKRVLARLLLDDEASGSHERAPDGFMLAYGTGVASGHYSRGSIVDVAPTLLYFLGLPVGRDMDGAVRADLFRRTFTAERPVTFIPSYE